EPINHSRWKSHRVDSSGRQTYEYANNGARNVATNQGAYLDLEQLAFLADNRDTIISAQASQKIPSPTAFQTDDLDAFDSDCDDAPSAKAVLMTNLSSYDSDVLLEGQPTEILCCPNASLDRITDELLHQLAMA
nr:hypothetical protein [Tanacetum cinerariifolium]